MEQDSLVARIQAGDENAASELVSHYGKMVYYTALAELGDADRALEVTGRTVNQALEAIRSGETPDDLMTYLQQQVRFQGASVASEASIMDAVREDVELDAAVDSIIGGIAPASSVSSVATVAPEPSPAPAIEPASAEEAGAQVEEEAPAQEEPPADEVQEDFGDDGADDADEGEAADDVVVTNETTGGETAPIPAVPAEPRTLSGVPEVSAADLEEELASIDGTVVDAEMAFGDEYARPDRTTPIPADAVAAAAAKSDDMSIDAQADAIIGELASSNRTTVDVPGSIPEAAPTVVDVPSVPEVAPAETAETVVDGAAIPVPDTPGGAAIPATDVPDEPVVGAVDLVSDDELANVDSDLHKKFYGQADSKLARTGHGIGILGVIIVILLAVLLIWLLLGFLVKLEVIPGLDLGYGWFNENVYPLF